jgi:hypothetical protein
LKKGHFEKGCRIEKQADKKPIKRQKQEAKVSLATASKATADAVTETALIPDASIW